MKAALTGLLTRLRQAAIDGAVPEAVFLEQAGALGLRDVERERLREELAGLGLPVLGMVVHADGDGPHVEKVARISEENVRSPAFPSGNVVGALLSRYADPEGYLTPRALDGVARLTGIGARDTASLRGRGTCTGRGCRKGGGGGAQCGDHGQAHRRRESLATRRPSQSFLRWCMKTGRMPRLALPPAVITQDSEPLHQHRRLAILRRVLNDDSLPLRARVAAALVLLYAQTVSRIVRLALDDITDDGTTVTVRMGEPPSPLPKPAADLMRAYIRSRQHMPYASSRSSQRLFPGRQPGQPMNPVQVHLREIGVPPQRGRTSAIRQLVLQAPAPSSRRRSGTTARPPPAWSAKSEEPGADMHPATTHADRSDVAALMGQAPATGPMSVPRGRLCLHEQAAVLAAH